MSERMHNPTEATIGNKIVSRLLLAKAGLEHEPSVEKLHAYNEATVKAVADIDTLARENEALRGVILERSWLVLVGGRGVAAFASRKKAEMVAALYQRDNPTEQGVVSDIREHPALANPTATGGGRE